MTERSRYESERDCIRPSARSPRIDARVPPDAVMPPHGPRLSGTNLERAADHNQRVTLHAIRVGGALTRVELARITGLTAPAIANITRRLMDDGLIEGVGQRRGQRGQPPTRLAVRADACHAIGVNIDRDHVTVVIVDFAGRTLARASWDIAFALPDQVRDLYREAAPRLVKEAGIDASRLVGLGVAVPDQLGSVDLPGRPADYTTWEGFDLPTLFTEPFALPVFTENDAAAAAMGEMQLGRGQELRSFFYILVSSGLGGGLVVDGAYFRGADGRSGELGFLRDPATGEQVQALVSLSGLAGAAAAAGLTLNEALADDFRASLVRDDWLERAAARLVGPLAAVNLLINPAAVLIGGRLPAPLVERLADRAEALLRERARDLPAISRVSRAALSEDAPAVGAAILPFSHFLLPKPGALWKAAEPAG